ncbi:HAD domain-containing protein [Georgenia yuyongxinii]|uniref:Uncharacterized protein n=1 Tax=Georgenia yuyongxinii TaxID=2589797 RepID=A0A552WNY6_9MICO|nr:HAD domain-containing protein [Georgenia yuyongxinii]TRW44404.1 hypothetical protein FJ693_13825 [Georgenia yuyongxinii]
MSAPLLLIDIDGTLLPLGPVEEGTSIRYGRKMRLPVRWPVVQAVAGLSAAGVEVIWLTTWTDELALRLGEQLRLPQFQVPAQVDEPARRPTWWHGWKSRTALSIVEQRRPRRWAWADDDIPTTVRSRLRREHPEGLVIAPDGQTGLTAAHMTRIEEWLLKEPIRDVVHQLNTALGPTIVAALSGATISTLPERWVEHDGPIPSPQEKERLRAAHRIWTQLADAEGPDLARAWLIGDNPVLEQAPYLALRAGAVDEAVAAAAAFTTGTWSL